MKTRGLLDSDIPALNTMAEASGFPYLSLDSPLIVDAAVVVDDTNGPLMAAVAERLVQLYLFADSEQFPEVKLHGIRLLHEELAVKLKQQGYSSAEVFLPPQISATFGRRLERSFGWKRNWPSWTKAF